MSAAHEEMGLTLTQFNAVVEDAYLACDDARIPYHVCNQLIAALAPFERVIVTK
jgi:hemoglobin